MNSRQRRTRRREISRTLKRLYPITRGAADAVKAMAEAIHGFKRSVVHLSELMAQEFAPRET